MIDISISTATLALSLLGMAALVVGIVIAAKGIFARRSQTDLAETPSATIMLEGRNKYPEVDVFKLSGTFFNVGLALALGLVIMAFGWTQYDKKVYIPEDALVFDNDIEMEPPRTATPPPPPPPPPPPVIEEVPEELIDEEEAPEFLDQSITANDFVEAPAPVQKEVALPPPPLPAKVDEGPGEIVSFAEEMPRFPSRDCEDLLTIADKKACADQKLLEFIYKHIRYPAIARENGIEGTATITFVVEKDGKITDAQILRDPGGQCGQEALRVVNLMNEKQIIWKPGKQRGRPVRVQFNLPVKFKLEN